MSRIDVYDEKAVYELITNQTQSGYRINELILFSYPVRKVKISATVNKQPDADLKNVYCFLLQCIQRGLDTKEELFEFLGIQRTDEFILHELYVLKDRGLLDTVSGKYRVTSDGDKFLQDNDVLIIEDKEEYEFLVDGTSGCLLSAQDVECKKNIRGKNIERSFNEPKSTLLNGRYQDIADLYKRDAHGKAYLINYSDTLLSEDNTLWVDYWLVEYIPIKSNSDDPYIQIRNVNENLNINHQLSDKFNREYGLLLRLTDSDRKEEEVKQVIEQSQFCDFINDKEDEKIQALTVWETKRKFIESLQTVKYHILIESPWIKKATLEYIKCFEELLEDDKKLTILYGIDENSEHDFKTMQKLNDLLRKYEKNFRLIDLSEHLRDKNRKLTGTHRKLLIKDNDYYISGSFNFLSFAKREGEPVANEESHLIKSDVPNRWRKIIEEYNLPIEPPAYKGNRCKIEEKQEAKNVVAQNSHKSDDIVKKYEKKSLSLNSLDVEDDEIVSGENWMTDNYDNPKIGVIELSTKAVKWLCPCVDSQVIKDGFSHDNFFSKSEKTETGNGLDEDNMMDMNFFRSAVLPSIKMAYRTLKDKKVDCIKCVATAAYRSAKNRVDILSCIKKEVGIDVCVLSKKQEAEATLWAYLCSSGNDRIKEVPNVLLIDQGGGSTEVSFFQNQEIVFCHSFDIGTTVLKNDFFRQDSQLSIQQRFEKIDEKYTEKLRQELMKFSIPQWYGDMLCICVGTAITASIGSGNKSNKNVHDKQMSILKIQETITRRSEELYNYSLSTLQTVAEKRNNSGEFTNSQFLDKKFVCRLGLPTILNLMKSFKVEELRINGAGLWYGIFYQMFYGAARNI